MNCTSTVSGEGLGRSATSPGSIWLRAKADLAGNPDGRQQRNPRTREPTRPPTGNIAVSGESAGQSSIGADSLGCSAMRRRGQDRAPDDQPVRPGIGAALRGSLQAAAAPTCYPWPSITDSSDADGATNTWARPSATGASALCCQHRTPTAAMRLPTRCISHRAYRSAGPAELR